MRYVFFDIETVAEEVGPSDEETAEVQNPENDNILPPEETVIIERHVANCLVADFYCTSCIDAGIPFESEDRAADCICLFATHNTPTQPRRQHVFTRFSREQQSPVSAFLELLMKRRESSVRTILISHNGGKFDTHLILEECVDRGNLQPKLTINGLKIFK